MLPFLPGSVALAVGTANAMMATAAIPKTCRRSTIEGRYKMFSRRSMDAWAVGRRLVEGRGHRAAGSQVATYPRDQSVSARDPDRSGMVTRSRSARKHVLHHLPSGRLYRLERVE